MSFHLSRALSSEFINRQARRTNWFSAKQTKSNLLNDVEIEFIEKEREKKELLSCGSKIYISAGIFEDFDARSLGSRAHLKINRSSLYHDFISWPGLAVGACLLANENDYELKLLINLGVEQQPWNVFFIISLFTI